MTRLIHLTKSRWRWRRWHVLQGLPVRTVGMLAGWCAQPGQQPGGMPPPPPCSTRLVRRSGRVAPQRASWASALRGLGGTVPKRLPAAISTPMTGESAILRDPVASGS